jgi:WD40 repeat protein
VKVWDVATGQAAYIFNHTREVQGVAFSPDGKRLATASEDMMMRIYLLDIEDLIALARTRVTRSLTSEECRQYLQTAICPPLLESHRLDNPPHDELF